MDIRCPPHTLQIFSECFTNILCTMNFPKYRWSNPNCLLGSHFFIQPNCQPNVSELYKWNGLNSLLGSHFFKWPNYDPNVSELHNQQFISHSVLESHFFNGPIFTHMLRNCTMKVHFTFQTGFLFFQ
jgi:hypothetical protein